MAPTALSACFVHRLERNQSENERTTKSAAAVVAAAVAAEALTASHVQQALEAPDKSAIAAETAATAAAGAL